MRSKVIMVTVAVAAVIVVAVGIRTVAQPYGSGYGMMGGGYGSSYGPGYGMMAGYGGGPGMMGGCGGGYGPGWMMQGYSGGGCGPGMMYGYGPANQGNLNLTADQVKQYLGQMIRNPNLKVGDVKEKDADTIVAEIVTKEKEALVQRLDFNRHNGFVQPEQ
jgi:hypothetical protein